MLVVNNIPTKKRYTAPDKKSKKISKIINKN